MAKRKKQPAAKRAPAAKSKRSVRPDPVKPTRGRPPREPGDDLKGRFGKRIKAMRLAKGLATVADFAEAAGLARSSVAQYEAGAFAPGLEELAKLAQALETTMTKLVEGLEE